MEHSERPSWGDSLFAASARVLIQLAVVVFVALVGLTAFLVANGAPRHRSAEIELCVRISAGQCAEASPTG